jgi:hypothetical protein
MEHIDDFIAAQDAREQVYRLTIENMYLREQLRKLQDELSTLVGATSTTK